MTAIKDPRGRKARLQDCRGRPELRGLRDLRDLVLAPRGRRVFRGPLERKDLREVKERKESKDRQVSKGAKESKGEGPRGFRVARAPWDFKDLRGLRGTKALRGHKEGRPKDIRVPKGLKVPWVLMSVE